MTYRRTSSQSRKSILGAGALTLGLYFFFVNLDGLTAQVSSVVCIGAEAPGMLPALGLAGWHALQAYTFDHAQFLSSLTQILVSFWPLLLIAAGAVLLRPLARRDPWPQGACSGSSAVSAQGDH